MLWREALVGLFDAFYEVHVQKGAWNAELDDDLPSVDGVASSALTSCRTDELACHAFSFVVALLLGNRIIPPKKRHYLHLRQR